MAEKDLVLTKAKIEDYLSQFASFYEKNGGTKPFELIIVGGSAIVLKHGFRETTHDIDASYPDDEIICKSIIDVDKKNGLGEGWMNKGVECLDSSYPLFSKYSEYYATYGKVTVKVIDTDHLIAMKLYAGRPGPLDRSDLLGLFVEEANVGRPVKFERVNKAFTDLYGNWDKCAHTHKKFLESIFNLTDLLAMRGVYGTRDAESMFDNKDVMNAVRKMDSLDELKEYIDALGLSVPDENLANYMKEVKESGDELSDDDLDAVVGGAAIDDVKRIVGADWQAYTQSCLIYMKQNPDFVPVLERATLGADGEWHTTVKVVLGADGNWYTA